MLLFLTRGQTIINRISRETETDLCLSLSHISHKRFLGVMHFGKNAQASIKGCHRDTVVIGIFGVERYMP